MSPPVPSPADREEALAILPYEMGLRLFANFDEQRAAIASALARARLAGAAAEREHDGERDIIEELATVLRAFAPKAKPPTGWWCPECQDWIACATFYECCTTCGTHLPDVQPTGDWYGSALIALEHADAVLALPRSPAAVVGARPAPEGAEGTR